MNVRAIKGWRKRRTKATWGPTKCGGTGFILGLPVPEPGLTSVLSDHFLAFPMAEPQTASDLPDFPEQIWGTWGCLWLSKSQQ